MQKRENPAKRFQQKLDFFHRCFSGNPKYNERPIFLIRVLPLASQESDCIFFTVLPPPPPPLPAAVPARRCGPAPARCRRPRAPTRRRRLRAPGPRAPLPPRASLRPRTRSLPPAPRPHAPPRPRSSRRRARFRPAKSLQNWSDGSPSSEASRGCRALHPRQQEKGERGKQDTSAARQRTARAAGLGPATSVRRTTGLEDGKSGDKTVIGTEALATEAAARMEDSIGDVKRTGQSVVRRGESVVERQQECRGDPLGYNHHDYYLLFYFIIIVCFMTIIIL
ncbi:hypothetical protein PAHAL_3G238000 [Panicum hallii]|uniref:Uncharacterized protein n=1 Tax=Panicum hallii TaxID=206008 RepID=A0A2T8KJ53_9POAL|nr:hypothetical protein PAHAL_3G238000 [Panicum hallii]